jgi:hypothetical protein
MSVIFNNFQFQNDAGLDSYVMLEAPVGSNLFSQPLKVAANSSATVPPFSIPDVQSLKLTVTHTDDPTVDTESFDCSKTGNSYPTFITAFVVRYDTIGEFQGEISLAFVTQ